MTYYTYELSYFKCGLTYTEQCHTQNYDEACRKLQYRKYQNIPGIIATVTMIS